MHRIMVISLLFAALWSHSTHFASAEGVIFAQGDIRIPSDAQLERMEERAIITSPLDVGGAPPRLRSGEEAEIRAMDERDRRMDERLLRGGICADCK
jgi:hypothetical protein